MDHKRDCRVLVVVRWPVGGIRTYILYNYPILTQTGYRFTFLGPADDSFNDLRKDVHSWADAEFVTAPVAGRRCQLRSTVRRQLQTGRFDLIHSHGLTAGIAAILGNVRLGIPHVITSHDVIRANQYPGMAGYIKRYIISRLLRRANALVAVSCDAMENHLEYLPRLSNGRCRLVTVVNGIDTARVSQHRPEGPRQLRDRLGIDDDVFLIGFLGRFMEQKGFLILIDALDRLFASRLSKRCHLVAVGSGDYVREYRGEVDRRPRLSGGVSFVEHVADAAHVLRGLDLLVVPSLWEACPLLPMEAMCLGIPVLGTDCLGLREVLADTPSVMIPNGDAAALARAMRMAIEAPWKKQATAFAASARERFDAARSAEQLRATFEQCLG
jgi:glycosyltransferase involved in cell wall biosynthesis